MERWQDKIRGSLIGGAAGDALGYAVEFSDEPGIFSTYGSAGIRHYRPDPITKKALISDDTQMTLFTASAILFRDHRLRGRGIAAFPREYANMTYQDWLITQEMRYEDAKATVIRDAPDYPDGFLSVNLGNVPELFSNRAPGITCLSALRTRRKQRQNHIRIDSFINDKINNSKGCGGIMRVAPVGLCFRSRDIGEVDREGAECAAITHSHPLGYLSAAVLVHILHRIMYGGEEMSLKDIVTEARDTAAKLFDDDENIAQLTEIIDKAVRLSENADSDLDNIHRLGEGWVAEETLAIAVYCSLKYQNDFSKAIIAAVNHKGDSDSTGAVTGNIVGAICGYEAIDREWKEDLELEDVILNTADALCRAEIE